MLAMPPMISGGSCGGNWPPVIIWIDQQGLVVSHVRQSRLGVLWLVQATQVKQLLELLLVLLLRLLVMMLCLLMMGLQRGQGLHVFDVLLQDQHVVRMFLTSHVYPQVPGDVGLVVADVAAKRWFRFTLIPGLASDVWAVVLLVVRTSRRHGRLLRGRWIAGARGSSAALLELLHVVEMLVALHVNTEVTLRRGGIVAHLAPVGLVPAGVGLAAR